MNNLVDLATSLPAIITDPSHAVITPAAGDKMLLVHAGALAQADISALPSGGSVTSVGLSGAPTAVFGISGSPVTTTGTLALSMKVQNLNTVMAGPISGSATTPGFRSLVPADMATNVKGITAFTIDATLSNVFSKQLTSNTLNTLIFTTGTGSNGQVIKVWIQQPVSGGTATLAWTSPGGSIRWPGGTAPALTLGPQKIDIFEFVCMGGDSYYGIRWGANLS